jgi:HSP20 family molecular chaperone IbpA
MKNNSKEVILEIPLKKFKRDEINVKIKKDYVEVKADKKTEKNLQRKEFFHEERTENTFYYKTSIPPTDYKKALVEFRGGILKIRIPKPNLP